MIVDSITRLFSIASAKFLLKMGLLPFSFGVRFLPPFSSIFASWRAVSAVPVFQIHCHKECDTRRQPQHPSAHTATSIGTYMYVYVCSEPRALDLDLDADGPVMTLTQLGDFSRHWFAFLLAIFIGS